MDCFYINLDSAEDRQRHLEENFAAYKQPGWTLTRFPAIDKTYIERTNVPGATRPGEKGCFLSHQLLMERQIGGEKNYLILEDDAAFGANTCALIDKMLSQGNSPDWDILFTDVCIPNMPLMFELVKYRRGLAEKKIDVAFLDLRGLEFAGSTAYIVNGRSKRKVYEALTACRTLDLPYDLYLRQLAHRGILNIYSLFPFVTTVSDFCDASQIKAAGNPVELTWNLFRRMIWTERNLGRCTSMLDSFRQTWCRDEPAVTVPGTDEELSAFTYLFSSMAAIRT